MGGRVKMKNAETCRGRICLPRGSSELLSLPSKSLMRFSNSSVQSFEPLLKVNSYNQGFPKGSIASRLECSGVWVVVCAC